MYNSECRAKLFYWCNKKFQKDWRTSKVHCADWKTTPQTWITEALHKLKNHSQWRKTKKSSPEKGERNEVTSKYSKRHLVSHLPVCSVLDQAFYRLPSPKMYKIVENTKQNQRTRKRLCCCKTTLCWWSCSSFCGLLVVLQLFFLFFWAGRALELRGHSFCVFGMSELESLRIVEGPMRLADF